MSKVETTEVAKFQVSVGNLKDGMFSLVPQNLDQAIKLAELISGSDLAPKDFKGKPGNVLIAMQMGSEVGLSPMQSIQNIAVINGRPSIYGDAGKGLLLQHGCRIEERDIKEVKNLQEARCKITRPDGSPPTIRTFSLEDAKTAGLWGKEGPWKTHPYRQMAWRAFWFAARDAAADYLRGLNGAEETGDYEYSQSEKQAKEEDPIAAPRSMKDRASDAEIVNKATGELSPEPGEDNTDPDDLPPVPEGAKEMDSKRELKCTICEKDILIQDRIVYDPSKGRAAHRNHFQ